MSTILRMTYPADAFFDIETLVNVAQPSRILLLGADDTSFLDRYMEQKSLINQPCTITHLQHGQIDEFQKLDQPFDVGIALNWFEHINHSIGAQTLAKMRDVLSPQYCVCLPLAQHSSDNGWHLSDLFSFALSKVASYKTGEYEYGLFKYNINDYKKTPNWLNADNWANPNMWGKYRW